MVTTGVYNIENYTNGTAHIETTITNTNVLM